MEDPVKKYQKKIRKSHWYQVIREKSKKMVLPGFEKVPLFDVIKFFTRGVKNGGLNTRASAISFKFFMAIFPSLLFFFTIIPYIPVEGIHASLLELIKDFMPHNAYQATEETIKDILNQKRGGLLSLGAFLTLYFATNGITSIFDAFNKTIHIDERRSPLKKRITAIWMVFIVSLIIILAVILLTFGTSLLNFLAKQNIIRSSSVITVIQIGKYFISIGMLFFSISFIYYMAPAKKFKFRLISVGSTIATFCSLLITLGFKYFVSNFGSYNALYGSIGTLIVIMLFIYFNSISLLIGFEINASIRSASLHENNNSNPLNANEHTTKRKTAFGERRN
ncbi:MAG: YihY/virulence factor BrkB family protein [Bacteroidales bacterium]